jgi:hypothetical protein
VAAAAGAAAAFFGVRALVNRVQRRAYDQQRLERLQGRFQSVGTGQGSEEFRGRPAQATRYQPQDQPDRMPVPDTGAPDTVVEDLARDVAYHGETVETSDQSTRLARYLLAFSNMIDLLRERRRESDSAGAAGRSLTPADRSRILDVVDRLEEDVPDYGLGNLEDDSPQERAYRLMVKVRDALQNLDYTDDDLFRLYGEVRSEACRALREIQPDGAGEELEQVYQAYECK